MSTPAIAVYSLTRDRLAYTQACFASLKEKAGAPYDHFVVDNGSEDGTVAWLCERKDEFKHIFLLDSNIGISKASNLALDKIFAISGYRLIVKYDNDCSVKSDRILEAILDIYDSISRFGADYVLSPRVEGICNQPTRGAQVGIGGHTIGLTAIVGGLFHCVPFEVYRHYRYPEILPLAKGQDDHFCSWFKLNGGQVGYIEDLVVEHYRSTERQAIEFPDYFQRKAVEEITIP